MRKLLAGLALLALAFSLAAQQLPPFKPADTKNRAVTGTAASLTLPTALAGTGSVQYVLTSFCSASERIFFRSDGTVATTSNGMPILANNAVLVTLPASITAISVIGDGTACTIYATVGLGG